MAVLPGALHRGRDRARRRASGRRARLRAGARLLRLRLPEGARGRVRPARLPVDLAARALRARVPLRAAERAADGLLSAGRARPRGAAAGDRGPAAARQPERGRVPGRARELAVRIGLGYVLGVAEEEVQALVAERERGGALRRRRRSAARSGAGPRHARAARVGRRVRRAWPRRRGRCWQTGRRHAGPARSPGGVQLALPLEAPAAPALRELTRWERLVADYGSIRISLAEHPLALLRADLPEEALSSRGLERLPHGGAVMVAGPGRRAPAPGDREGRHVHAARGRVGNDQPDRRRRRSTSGTG